MRRLIYVPIIHTEADMGTTAGDLKAAYVQRHGQAQWDQHVKAINEMWDGVCRKVEALHLDGSKTKLYQDGLPVCGKELEIVTEVAGRGSRNYQLLLELIRKGCTLMGTESGQLLTQEYRLIQEALQAKGKLQQLAQRFRMSHQGRQLLERRDRFIARRIHETLKEGEAGLLFVGIQHAVDRFLNRDIQVTFLFHRLPFGQSAGAR